MSREEMVTVLIADNNKHFAEELKKHITTDNKIEVVAVTNNGEEALEKIEELKPDVALVDLVMPTNDGLWIMEELKQKNIDYASVIAISCFENETVSQMASDLGAKYFMVKPVCFNVLKRRILQVNKIVRASNNAHFEVKELKDKKGKLKGDRLDNIVSTILARIGISPRLKGYGYIKSSIVITTEERDAMVSVTKKLYPDVAKLHNVTSGQVERAMRHAIQSAWGKNNGESFGKGMGMQFLKKPTNSQLIASISEYIKTNY